MATNNVVNSFKKITVEERAEMKEKFADVSIRFFDKRLFVEVIIVLWWLSAENTLAVLVKIFMLNLKIQSKF